MLYPLKFKPILQSKIWGGEKIKKYKFAENFKENIGEVWLLSGVEGNETLVENGNLLNSTINDAIEVFMSDLLGEKIYQEYGDFFPLLYKIIDANDNLSVQVHPDEDISMILEDASPKNEMWYVLDADNEAKIYLGFNKDIDALEVKKSIEENTILSLLNEVKVKSGDVYFIPAGTIHALGRGVVVAEIQQASDTTYRVWDWNRTDEKGNSRELHIEEALQSFNYAKTIVESMKSASKMNGVSRLIKTPYFTANEMLLNKSFEKDYSDIDSFVCLLCVKGNGYIKQNGVETSIEEGEVVLLPAITEKITIETNNAIRILESYIDN
ncbi:mannose-6-phosphate isomerase [Bacteroidia bacterium]|nr:mannose-6-phosphate isomerase [Bacteroidia bacterium]